MSEPIVCHCCGSPPIIGPSGVTKWYRGHCACTDAMQLALRHKRELAHLYEVVARKNRELDALHFVWCDGGCASGVHRFDHDELTQEIVDEAVRNTERLKRWWQSRKAKREM